MATQLSVTATPGMRYVFTVIHVTAYADVSYDTTSYTDVAYISTTLYDTYPGFGIMCDNNDIYCDSEDYYCDGSVVMRAIKPIMAEETAYGSGKVIYNEDDWRF
jgi:hypothetical protein